MQLTLPARGKEGAKNYREKRVFNFSVKQARALQQEFFVGDEEAVGVLGKQARQVLASLVTLGLFKQKRDGSYDRTREGAEVAERMSERV